MLPAAPKKLRLRIPRVTILLLQPSLQDDPGLVDAAAINFDLSVAINIPGMQSDCGSSASLHRIAWSGLISTIGYLGQQPIKSAQGHCYSKLLSYGIKTSLAVLLSASPRSFPLVIFSSFIEVSIFPVNSILL